MNMQNFDMKTEWETGDNNKVVSLFQFLKELNKLKQKSILNVDKQIWYYPLSKLHADPENIELHYRDRVDVEDTTISETLLSVKKPDFHRCPKPTNEFAEWLEAGWDDYKNNLRVKEYIERNDDAESETGSHSETKEIQQNAVTVLEYFGDNEGRVAAFKAWEEQRDHWVEKQKTAEKTRDLFNKIYSLFFELQKESETEEIVVANGMVYDAENSEIAHPVLTHRVKIDYDPEKNVVYIKDSEVPSELYSIMLQAMDGVNTSTINTLNDDLIKNDYHPLDRNDTPTFLKVLINQLSSDSVFSDSGIPYSWRQNGRFLLTLEPCFIVRKRLDGTVKAIEQIIENIQDTGEVPAPIDEIVSGGLIDVPEDIADEPIEDQLAAVGGESIDILLSKEANREQLEIAKRIEYYNAVLVQGPPGTGKTHTIANIMGHLLAQGKSVLVTSHTTKALNVLKEKVAPGLQDLCVSVLEDSNADMEKSIDGITQYMARTTSHELKREMNDLADIRRSVISDLAKVRRSIFQIINRECNNIVLNGEEISPSEAARFVHENAETLSIIPGHISIKSPLPLTKGQLAELYKSNGSLSESEEQELGCLVPSPNLILSPSDYGALLASLKTNIAKRREIANENNLNVEKHTREKRFKFDLANGSFIMPCPDEANITALKKYVSEFGHVETWMKRAAVDGKNGGAFREQWDVLIENIKGTCDFAESILKDQLGHIVKFAVDDPISLENVYERMSSSFSASGGLSKMTLFFHSDYATALKQATVNGKEVSKAEECTLVLKTIQLYKMRKQCGLYWDELFGQNEVPRFDELDTKAPERIAANWIPLITKYLDWYKTDYQPLKDLLERNNIPVSTVMQSDPLDSDIVATGKILDAVENTIPALCDICLLLLKENEILETIQKTKDILGSGSHAKSATCKRILEAINNVDTTAYTDAYSSLQSLYSKYELQSKRTELLGLLEPCAPDWADAIRKREGIHGEDTAPADIYDAWRWKQLSGVLDELTSKSFSDLQAESLRLSREYRRVTALYAEKSAWYHLLNRTEADISMKQALQGWKQTVKRIGKGTGKQAPRYKAEARRLMTKCQKAVPGWIMPINKALETLDPKSNRFDVIIIDEASQSDISALAILYMGKKLIIVGDDKQVSPLGIGVDSDKMSGLQEMFIKDKIPNAHLYNYKTSIYDIAATTFQPLMLREHFRCVPEIIGFSNMLSYDGKIKPLRDASSSALLPAVVNYRVSDGIREHGKVNRNEAQMIVALMKACIEQPEYEGKTFGVISMLGDEQAKLLQQYVESEIDRREVIKRKILCGNSANFQGDERDVIFLSMVDSGEKEGPLSMRGFGPDDVYRKRYNVAASRAKDQLWVVDSLDSANDLRSGDIRKTLIDYSLNPEASEIKSKKIEDQSESPFEARVAKALVNRGYHIAQQWKVGAYRLDIVAIFENKKVAIECDGERWHSSESQIRQDMERQTILERLGWQFIRIRGSEFFRNPEATIDRVVQELSKYGIQPETAEPVSRDSRRNTELLQRVKARAVIIRYGETESPEEPVESTIAAALNEDINAAIHAIHQEDNNHIVEKPSEPVVEESDKSEAIIKEKRVDSHTTKPVNRPKKSYTSRGKRNVRIVKKNLMGWVTFLKDGQLTFPVLQKNEKKTEKKVETNEQLTISIQQVKKPKSATKAKVNEQLTLPGLEDVTKKQEQEDVISILKKNNVKYIDKRAKGGALWIVGGRELSGVVEKCKKVGVKFTYKESGGKQTKGAPGWWAK